MGRNGGSGAAWSEPANYSTSASGSIAFADSGGGSTDTGFIDFEVMWVNAANAGTFAIQTAQDVNAGTTSFLLNSSMTYQTI
jgi:hypothetical protein